MPFRPSASSGVKRKKEPILEICRQRRPASLVPRPKLTSEEMEIKLKGGASLKK